MAILVGAAAGLILFVAANLIPLIDDMCVSNIKSDLKIVNDLAFKFK